MANKREVGQFAQACGDSSMFIIPFLQYRGHRRARIGGSRRIDGHKEFCVTRMGLLNTDALPVAGGGDTEPASVWKKTKLESLFPFGHGLIAERTLQLCKYRRVCGLGLEETAAAQGV